MFTKWNFEGDGVGCSIRGEREREDFTCEKRFYVEEKEIYVIAKRWKERRSVSNLVVNFPGTFIIGIIMFFYLYFFFFSIHILSDIISYISILNWKEMIYYKKKITNTMILYQYYDVL